MTYSIKHLWYLLLAVAVLGSACDRPVNVFTVQQDKQLGAQLDQELANNPQEYPILDPAQYPVLYSYMYEMQEEILNSPEIKFKDEFEWQLRIIADDNTLNAFAAPGGYVYIYTGLMKYLDKVDNLAGILAHEIAHADQRHSTSQMTKRYGLEMLVAVASGNSTSEQLGQLASGLTQLGFSRADENDADNHSVDYLQSTKYACNGAAGFFEKLLASGQASTTPVWLSTHPDSEDRMNNINSRASEANCTTAPSQYYHDNGDNGAYAAVLATLP